MKMGLSFPNSERLVRKQRNIGSTLSAFPFRNCVFLKLQQNSSASSCGFKDNFCCLFRTREHCSVACYDLDRCGFNVFGHGFLQAWLDCAVCGRMTIAAL
jgi:hypothetical protein